MLYCTTVTVYAARPVMSDGEDQWWRSEGFPIPICPIQLECDTRLQVLSIYARLPR
jgi:hypothetical protein